MDTFFYTFKFIFPQKKANFTALFDRACSDTYRQIKTLQRFYTHLLFDNVILMQLINRIGIFKKS